MLMPTRPAIHRPITATRVAQSDRQQEQARLARNPWRRWYWTARWRRKAKAQLSSEPLCRMCAERGETTAASIADHVIPHRGNADRFWRGELQSLCKACHDGRKQRLERGARRVGLDGLPIEG